RYRASGFCLRPGHGWDIERRDLHINIVATSGSTAISLLGKDLRVTKVRRFFQVVHELDGLIQRLARQDHLHGELVGRVELWADGDYVDLRRHHLLKLRKDLGPGE